jgi:hypothetical protein
MKELLQDFALDWVVALVGTVVAGAWTFFKSRDLYQEMKEQKYSAAMDALEAGVEKTYRVYVEALKRAKADGKLTPEEKAAARQKAIAYAQEFGRTRGIDVIDELGREYIAVLIGKIVRALKGDARTKEA